MPKAYACLESSAATALTDGPNSVLTITAVSERYVPGCEAGYTGKAIGAMWIITKLKTRLRGLSPRANFTDRATAACRPS
jgi:hypothetical protein